MGGIDYSTNHNVHLLILTDHFSTRTAAQIIPTKLKTSTANNYTLGLYMGVGSRSLHNVHFLNLISD